MVYKTSRKDNNQHSQFILYHKCNYHPIISRVKTLDNADSYVKIFIKSSFINPAIEYHKLLSSLVVR